MHRALLLAGLILPLWGCDSSTQPGPADAPEHGEDARDSTPDGPLPNVVVYLVDTLRADRMSLYGYERKTTPVLDALAAESVVFDQAISQASWTLPSTVSLFTSSYSASHRVVSGAHKVDRSVETLVEFMQGLGYHTMGFVTNGLGGTGAGLDQGYDEFFQRPAQADMTPAMRAAGLHTKQPLMDMLRAYEGDKPLFMYVHAVEPHAPYQGAPKNAEGADGWHALKNPEINKLNRSVADYRGLQVRLNRNEPRDGDIERMAQLEPEVLAAMEDVRGLYDGDVLRADTSIGELLAMLKVKRLWDSTAFFLVADHGEEFLDHDLLGHGQSLYGEVVHVPFLARVPGLTDQGSRVPQAVQIIDVAPTLADLVGVDPLPFWQGRSLLPALQGETLPTAGALSVREHIDRPIKGWRGDHETALIRGRWKLIMHHDTDLVSLFDLEADPREQSNLADTEPERTAAMEAEIRDTLRALPVLPIRASEVGMDDEKLKQLRELGYLEQVPDEGGGH